ncbi:MAG: hypothetical protein IJT95_07205 [Abditibacteriota bacterium]|nr:hypothetical protein [Abditibacteriota bacterium]
MLAAACGLKAETVYCHSVLQGGVITKSFPFDQGFSWRGKCPECGKPDGTVYNDFGSSGTSSRSFTCSCGTKYKAVLHHVSYNENVPASSAETYYHVMLGGVIYEQNPFRTSFKYNTVCSKCGRRGSVVSSSGSSGSSRGTYTCPGCSMEQSWTLMHFSSKAQDMSRVYSHSALKGAVITELNPYSRSFAYRPRCEACGYTGSKVSTSGTSGSSESTFVCPKCHNRQTVLLLNSEKSLR